MCVWPATNLLWQLSDWLSPPTNIWPMGNKSKKGKPPFKSLIIFSGDDEDEVRNGKTKGLEEATITAAATFQPPLSSFPIFCSPLTPLVPLLSSFLLPFSPHVLPFLVPFFAAFQSSEERRVICGIVDTLPTVIWNLSSTGANPNVGKRECIAEPFISGPEQSHFLVLNF